MGASIGVEEMENKEEFSLAAEGQEGFSANAGREELKHRYGIEGLQMAVTGFLLCLPWRRWRRMEKGVIGCWIM